MIYGVDVSAYQPNFDFTACANEGFDFAFIKSTEGPLNYWASPNYHDQVGRARAAGLLVAAYHYVRGSDVAGQLANIRSMVDTDTPVILDVEEGAGSISSIRALNAALNEAGYRTPFIYIPRWYWSGHMGSPDLTGLPPNWHSAYPDNVVRRKDSFVDQRSSGGPDLRPTFPSFGGIPTVVAQFTSSLAVANYPGGRIDGNAFGGTREQLAAHLGGDDMPSLEDIKNMPIKLHPDVADVDQRPEAPFEEVLSYGNKASWLAADRSAANGLKLDALLGRNSNGDVDELELAHQLLVQGLGLQLGRIPDDQIVVLKKAVADEVERRQRVRLGVDLGKAEAEENGQ